MEKEGYFPRKRLFEEVQDLVAAFYSTGDYISDHVSEYATMLAREGQKDEFYYCLYLLSMLSGTAGLLKLAEKIIKGLNSFRVKRKVTSTEDFAGEMDIEEYITRNYIERAMPREYPSVIKDSSFQLPEYQLTLYIIRHCHEILRAALTALGEGDTAGGKQGRAGKDSQVTAFKIAGRYMRKLQEKDCLLRRKYGVSYSRRESYQSLKKKVVYRYRNRRIICGDFKELMKLYERFLSFQGINMESEMALELFDHCPAFDDRLYEIWLIRKSCQLLADRLAVEPSRIRYVPLFKARKDNSYAALVEGHGCRIEVLFQNRKNLMPRKELRWFYETDDGGQREIGAIPDLVFLKFVPGSEEPSRIVLADAKNRTWTFDHPEPIRSEVIQQIYIHDNFVSLFGDRFYSMLIAHNDQSLQTRRYSHKDHPDYVIDVVSLDLRDDMTESSLKKYGEDLSVFLDLPEGGNG